MGGGDDIPCCLIIRGGLSFLVRRLKCCHLIQLFFFSFNVSYKYFVPGPIFCTGNPYNAPQILVLEDGTRFMDSLQGGHSSKLERGFVDKIGKFHKTGKQMKIRVHIE